MTTQWDDEEEFVEQYLPLAEAIADRLGFAVKRPLGRALSEAERCRLVQARMIQAAGALTELGQWLDDDSEVVRRFARESVDRCLEIAYTGDQPEPTRGLLERGLNQVDRVLSSVLGRFVNPDTAAPAWSQPRRLRHLRSAGVGLAFLAAVLAAGAFWSDHSSIAMVFVLVLATFDTLEGSFARVTRMRDPQVRWLSCVLSHLGDTIVMFGMALALGRIGRQGLAQLLLVAATVSVSGSLVRVSALQAGHRVWRSPLERVVRFTAFVVFGALISAGNIEAGAVTASTMLAVFGIGEALRVMRRVSRLGIARGRFIFVTSSGPSSWSFDAEEGTVAETAIFERPAPTVAAVIRDGGD